MTERRQPISLRISVTDRCDLRCGYCMPADGVPMTSHHAVLRFEQIVGFVRFVHERFGLTKVHLTGGEPLVRRGIVDLVRAVSRLGVPDLAMTTNGQQLAAMADDLKHAGLARANVSLDSLDADSYRALTRGGDLARVFEGLAAARRAGIDPIKLNTVVLRGINDHEVVPIAQFALQHGHAVRFLELMPIGMAQDAYGERFVLSAEVRVLLSEAFVLRPMPSSPAASSRVYHLLDADGREGTVGFISPCSEPFCSPCRRLRLTATGRLLGCLARREGPDVRPLLGMEGPTDEAGLAAAIDEALALKRSARRFDEQQLMGRVGG